MVPRLRHPAMNGKGTEKLMAEDAKRKTPDVGVLISADSHVMEAGDFWVKNLPASLRAKAPDYPEGKQNVFQELEGGHDAKKRVAEMAKDGVSGEVLYPTRALTQFGIEDVQLQEACFKLYNDWLMEYCAAAPQRLFGVACIPAYRIDEAVRETERAKKEGMRGILLWQVPPEQYSFATRHHDPIFAAAEALDLPVSMHILTGKPYPPGFKTRALPPPEFMHVALSDKIHHAIRNLVDMVVSGTFDRFPRLKVVLVENEVSWMPFLIWQLDKYADKKYRSDYDMKLAPSEYFKRNIYTTFFNDPPVGKLIEDWGADTWMWSNDFPHPNSTWPNSRDVIARDLGHLPPDVLAKAVRETVAKVYSLPEILPVSTHS